MFSNLIWLVIFVTSEVASEELLVVSPDRPQLRLSSDELRWLFRVVC